MSMRIGQGVDVHPFSDDPGRPLVLGGVTLPGPGLSGHSDGDVVLHAVVDALLGASGAGDIGTVFGSGDPRYAGADSRVFLAETLRLVTAAGWEPVNVDCTIVAQHPRVGPHREAMQSEIAGVAGLAADAVNVKATTTDHLGFTGRAEGIACLAVVLLRARR